MKSQKENSDALYRKYRPQQFSSVLGQDHVVKVLKGSIELGNIGHAYLFAGTRGTGKTSVARIFAKEIGTSPNDLYEIDAASNRGIDDVRRIKESVATLPFESKYKVYIVDEAHMLTKEAWNAFLKTLEEPPAYVVFILATTELEKVPETVLSRCQVFSFKKPNAVLLKEMAIDVAKEEGFILPAASAELIATLGDGSFRDTHGILQKVISFSKDKKISAEEVEMVVGAPKNSLVNDCLRALHEKDLNSALEALRGVVESNVDMNLFSRLLLQKIRFVLLLRFAADLKGKIAENLSEEDLKLLDEIAKEKESGITSQLLLEILKSGELIRFAAVPELPLELAFIKLMSGEK